MIKYFPLVKTSYAAADAVQQQSSRRLLDYKQAATHSKADPGKTVPNAPSMAFLAYEMPPTYTSGRRQKGDVAKELLKSIPKVEGRSFEVVETLRGGHTTFHGPGQLVLYPILDSKQLNIKVRDYVCILEKSIVSLLARYGIKAEQRPGAGMNGVWIADPSHNSQQKIASVGVHVRRNVTSHGLALNIDMDPFWFKQIVPCNLPEAQMVSMSDFSSEKLSVSKVSDDLVEEIAKRMGLEGKIE